jgi:hypothetical protein
MPTLLNLILTNLGALGPMLIALATAVSAASLIYVCLAVTYGVAAKAAREDGHGRMARLYAISGVFHAVLGVCHHFHL